jgi:hypothetical protein
MRVFKVSEGENFASYDLNLEEKVLTVEGVGIDLEAEVQDCQTLIPITRTEGVILSGGSAGKRGMWRTVKSPSQAPLT